MTTLNQAPPTSPTSGNGGFEPLRPYGQPSQTSDRGMVAEDIVSLQLRLVEANERTAFLEEQLEKVTAERDAAEHRVADLEDRNHEMASDLDDALDIASAYALDEDQERLAVVPGRCVNAFARAAHDYENGYDR